MRNVLYGKRSNGALALRRSRKARLDFFCRVPFFIIDLLVSSCQLGWEVHSAAYGAFPHFLTARSEDEGGFGWVRVCMLMYRLNLESRDLDLPFPFSYPLLLIPASFEFSLLISHALMAAASIFHCAHPLKQHARVDRTPVERCGTASTWRTTCLDRARSSLFFGLLTTPHPS